MYEYYIIPLSSHFIYIIPLIFIHKFILISILHLSFPFHFHSIHPFFFFFFFFFFKQFTKRDNILFLTYKAPLSVSFTYHLCPSPPPPPSQSPHPDGPSGFLPQCALSSLPWLANTLSYHTPFPWWANTLSPLCTLSLSPSLTLDKPPRSLPLYTLSLYPPTPSPMMSQHAFFPYVLSSLPD